MLKVRGTTLERFDEILTDEALAFIEKLQRAFGERRRQLLDRRVVRQRELRGGKMPTFLPETEQVRKTVWKVAPIPKDLQDRRVEITGPIDRKMIINALNSGANVFMADFEDSNSPTWQNTLSGQVNLKDAVRRTIEFTNPKGKQYALADQTAVLFVRPRGWHLEEKHVELDGRPVSASLFDFGLYFFHNAKELLARGSGPYFYLPKLESHLEARLWNDVFVMAQELLGVPQGSVRATVLVETILAAFEMDEILWELREHSAGLNCGRWDYIFSIIKKFQGNQRYLLPDRGEVTMTSHALHAYSLLTIQTCHRRGIHAMGGMAAQIPIKGDATANDDALAKVRADKEREAGDGHDGTWVAHPALVALAKEAFDAVMPQPNQIDKLREDVVVRTEDLLAVPKGKITEKGLRHNIDVGIQYMAAWLSGNGCVPIYNLMEDAATAEISRSQLWQWVHHGATLEDGRPISAELVATLFNEELDNLRSKSPSDQLERAKSLIEEIVLADDFTDFITTVGYEHLS